LLGVNMPQRASANTATHSARKRVGVSMAMFVTDVQGVRLRTWCLNATKRV
jgi:hypothetical protein